MVPEDVMTADELKGIIRDTSLATMKEAGVVGDDGKLNVKAMGGEMRSEVGEKKEQARLAANYIKGIVLPNHLKKQYGYDAGMERDVEMKEISTDGASMGSLVPTLLYDVIVSEREKLRAFRSRAFTLSLSGKIDVPIDGTGVTANWIGENTLVTESDHTTTTKPLDDHALAARVVTPWKLLLQSPFNIVNYVGRLSGRALADAEESAFIGGNGTGKPKGLRTETVTSDAATSPFAYGDMVKLYNMIEPQYLTNAVFLTSQLGKKVLMSLQDDVKRPLMEFGGTVPTIFGLPVITSSFMPSNLGVGGDETEIWIGDLSNYWIKDGESMQMRTGEILEKMQTQVLVYEFVDGRAVDLTGFAKLTGVK
jgi:HK97 family phage major capsid protein